MWFIYYFHNNSLTEWVTLSRMAFACDLITLISERLVGNLFRLASLSTTTASSARLRTADRECREAAQADRADLFSATQLLGF